MSCVSKRACTHVIIRSLWLICYIHCGFSISYLSIPGIAAYDRCTIPHSYFFFSISISCCAFLLYNCFLGGLKTGQRGRGDGGGAVESQSFVSRLACLNLVHVYGLLFSLFLIIGIYYSCYQQYHYDYYHYYCYGYYIFIHAINIII